MKQKIAPRPVNSIKFQDETKVHPVLEEYFGYCLFKASAWMRSIQDDILRDHKVQSFHLGVLKVLEISGPKSQIQLGDEMGIDKASMVKLIDHLEKSKLVQRQGHLTDRRVKNVFITAKGLKLIKDCVKARAEVEARFFKNLTDSEEKIFRRLISLVLPERKVSQKGRAKEE